MTRTIVSPAIAAGLALALWIPAGAQEDAPDNPIDLTTLDRAALKQIVADAGPAGSLDDLPWVYPEFSPATKSKLEVREGDLEFMEQLTVDQRVSRGRFLVLEIGSDNLTKSHSTDVLTFDEGAGLYRRWRLFPDGSLARMEGLGNNPPELVMAGGEEFQFLVECISWTGTLEGPQGDIKRRVMASERLSASGGEMKLGSSVFWVYAVLGNEGVERRENYNLMKMPEADLAAEPLPPKREPGGLGGLLGRLFGKEDAPPGNEEPAAEERPDYRFEELNFRFTHPAGGYVKMDSARINPDAALMLMKREGRTTMNLTVIAEDAGHALGFDTGQLVTISQTSLKASYPEVTSGEPQDVDVNGVSFAIYTSTGMVARGREATWIHLVSAHNGFLYQIILATLPANAEAARREALEIAKNFHVLDPERQGRGMSVAAAPYHHPGFGIGIDLRELGAIRWDRAELALQFPAATYGALVRQNAGLVVVPVDLGALDPDDEALTAALLEAVGLRYPDEITRTEGHEQGTATGRRLEARIAQNGLTSDYRLRVLRNGETACLLAAFTLRSEPEDLAELGRLLDAVEFVAPDHSELRRDHRGQTRKDLDIINSMGLRLYNDGKVAEALEYFRTATDAAPQNAIYFANAIEAYHNSGQIAEGLEFFDERGEPFADQPALQAERASLLAALDRPVESAREYRLLFDEGLRNEDHLMNYIGILSQLNRQDEAVEAVDAYLAGNPNPPVRVRRWQHQLYAQTGDTVGAVEAARQVAAEYPQNTQVQLDLVTALNDDEQADEALALIAQLDDPQNAALVYETGRAHLLQRDFRKAKEALERARELAPGDPFIADSLAYASAMLGQGDNSSIKRALDLVEPPAELRDALAGTDEPEARPGYNSRVRLSMTGFHFRPGKPLRRTEFREIELLNAAGVAEYKTLKFYFDPTYESAFINSLEVLDEDGAVVARGEVSDYYLAANVGMNEMATSESILSAPVPGLKPGHLLRYQITTETKASLEEFDFQRFLFAAGAPSGPRAIFLTGDIDSVHAVERHAEFRHGRGSGYAYWLLPSAPLIQFESSQPSFDEFLPGLTLGSQKKSWSDVGRDYLDSIADRLAPSEEVRQLAARLTEDLDDPREKARALLHHVQKSLSYQAIEFGIRARTPNRTPRILRNRYGDCKDHSLLCHQLFEAAGLRSHLALVHNNSSLVESLPSLDQFNHMILFAPGFDGGVFLDATSKFQPFDLTAREYLAGDLALVLGRDQSRLIEIPEGPGDENEVRSRRRITLAENLRDFLVEERVSFHGYAAGYLRSFLGSANAADQKDLIAQLLGTGPKLDIAEVTVEQLDALEEPLVVTMSYAFRRGLQDDGPDRSGSLPALWEGLYFNPGAAGKRRTPFEIVHPFVFRSEITWQPPSGITASEPAWKDGRHSFPWLGSELRSSANGDDVAQHAVIRQKPGLFPAEDYASYASQLDHALEALRGRVTVTP